MLGHGNERPVVVRHGGEIRQIQGWASDRPDFFDRIDTPEQAYWLGFLGADGCMIITTEKHPEGNHLLGPSRARDKGCLIRREALGAPQQACLTGVSKGFPGKPAPSASLSVGSRRLTDALIALGIGPRKSATRETWDGPADLMPHYWRGMMDGDGSIAKKTPCGRYQAFLCGSEPCVLGFRAWVARH